MKNLPNIDKAAFRRGEYVGYCNGAQRIRRCSAGWETYALGSSAGKFEPARASTLEELSAILAARSVSLSATLPSRAVEG